MTLTSDSSHSYYTRLPHSPSSESSFESSKPRRRGVSFARISARRRARASPRATRHQSTARCTDPRSTVAVTIKVAYASHLAPFKLGRSMMSNPKDTDVTDRIVSAAT